MAKLKSDLVLPEAKNAMAESVLKNIERILPALHTVLDRQQFATNCVVAANELKPGSCDPNSVLLSAFYAARIGLYPGGTLGLCYFIPRKKQCNLEIGYQGYLEMSFRNKFLANVYADVVLRDEEFRAGVVDSRPTLNHETPLERDMGEKTMRDRVVGAYCVYQTSGGVSHRMLTRKQLDAVDSKGNVWLSHYSEMCRKTAIRRAAKDWSKTIDLRLALALDDQLEIGAQQTLGAEVPTFDSTPADFSLDDIGEEDMQPQEV
jgi:recombination protein RecT